MVAELWSPVLTTHGSILSISEMAVLRSGFGDLAAESNGQALHNQIIDTYCCVLCGNQRYCDAHGVILSFGHRRYWQFVVVRPSEIQVWGNRIRCIRCCSIQASYFSDTNSIANSYNPHCVRIVIACFLYCSLHNVYSIRHWSAPVAEFDARPHPLPHIVLVIPRQFIRVLLYDTFCCFYLKIP